MEENHKIPVEKVADDIPNPDDCLLSMAAREYFYTYYATAEEREKIDREDKHSLIFLIVFWILFLTGTVSELFFDILKGEINNA